jgi:hypothetical protein
MTVGHRTDLASRIPNEERRTVLVVEFCSSIDPPLCVELGRLLDW